MIENYITFFVINHREQFVNSEMVLKFDKNNTNIGENLLFFHIYSTLNLLNEQMAFCNETCVIQYITNNMFWVTL